MGAKYRFFRRPANRLKEGTEETFYPRIVGSRNVKFSDFFGEINQSSSFTEGDCAGLLKQMEHYLVRELLKGNRVRWEGVGSFYVLLDSEPIKDPDSIRAESIWGKTVVFVPDRSLIKTIKHIELEKDGPYKEPPKLTPQQRWENTEWYLNKREETITSSILMALNYCSRRIALQDLKEWNADGRLKQIGGGNNVMYTLNKKKEGEP